MYHYAAPARAGHEEDAVWSALRDSGLLVGVPVTELDLGPNLQTFPCLEPRKLVDAVAARGCIEAVIGVPWNFSHLDV